MLNDIGRIAKINYENIARDEAFIQAVWLLTGLASLGVFSATLSLFGNWSLGTTFASDIFGATLTNAHVLGAAALGYAVVRGGFDVDRFRSWDVGKQAIVFAGIGLFFLTGWSTGLESTIVGNDFYILLALAVENAAFIELNVLDS